MCAESSFQNSGTEDRDGYKFLVKSLACLIGAAFKYLNAVGLFFSEDYVIFFNRCVVLIFDKILTCSGFVSITHGLMYGA
jgi:hypothetical protein